MGNGVTETDQVIHSGGQTPAADQWEPLEWHEPGRGKQIHGEAAVIRPQGTSGSLCAGFWRTAPNAPGAAPDGSQKFIYSSALGDETECIIDGTAVLTVLSTGKQYHVGPGSIISCPKGLEVQWEVQGPFFKKFWCIWDGSKPTAHPPQDLLVGHVSDNPSEWHEHRFTEPLEGPQVGGELYLIRTGGSGGTMLSGVWRSGKGIAGTAVDSDGTLTIPYSGTLGDETMLLLEGEVEIIETLSGKKHFFRSGDVIGLPAGLHVTWISKGPFTKKLFIVTRDALPE